MHPPTPLLPLLLPIASATTLYATHFSGTLNTLTFTGTTLALTNCTRTGNTQPSWISYDAGGKAVYIGDEVFSGAQAGRLVSFAVEKNGDLKATGKGVTPLGAVATSLYGGADGTSFIANAHYQTSQLSTFALPLTGGPPLQTLNYTMSAPGKIPARQEVPHPHHVFPDPTGAFLIVPDLGADVLRIHRIDRATGALTECGAGKAVPGTGPRHGVFWGAGQRTTLFVANELANSVSGWKVAYPASATGCLSLTLRDTLTPYRGNASAVAGTKVAEVKVRDGFLYSTSRNDRMFGGNDSITQFEIAQDGAIGWADITSSYGTYARTFDINKAGDYVAVGDQTSSNVAVIARDVKTGRLGRLVASLRIGPVGTPEMEDGLSDVVWAE